MGHEHQVARLEPVVVDGVVVDVAQDGPGPHAVRQVLAVDVLAQLVHDLEIVRDTFRKQQGLLLQVLQHTWRLVSSF